MGTGKSVVGKELAKKLKMEFVEMDKEIEHQERMKIKDIFEKFGEKYFRDKETELVKKISDKEGIVISTGGGVVLRKENMEALRKKGIIVCLWASPENILKRIKETNERPLLNVADPLKKIKKMLAQRQKYYEKADISIHTDGYSPLQIVKEIIKKLKEYEP